MKTVINNTTIANIMASPHVWQNVDPYSNPIPRVLGDWTIISSEYQYNIYYTTDVGQEGFWQNYGPVTAGGTFNPLADGVNIIADATPAPNTNYFIRQSQIYDGIVNVKWFGAIGEAYPNSPTYPLDDFDAIQSAINFIGTTSYPEVNLRAGGGGTVFFPEGIYRISDQLVVGQQCRLLGISKSMDYNPIKDIVNDWSGQCYSRGSVILCDFYYGENPEQNTCKWAITSTAYDRLHSNELLKYNLNAYFDTLGIPTVTPTYGIKIENIFIDGTGYVVASEGQPIFNTNKAKWAYGGIRLAGAFESEIINCSVFGTKVGVLVNCNVNINIETVFTKCDWFGIITNSCNVINIIASDFTGWNNGLINEQFLPEFAKIDLNSSDWNVDSNIEFATKGALFIRTNSISITSSVAEQYLNCGMVFYFANASINSGYIENIERYSIVTLGSNTILEINNLLVSNSEYLFYLGNNSNLTANGIFSETSGGRLNIMVFPIEDPSNRVILFSNVRSSNQNYINDVVYLDNGININTGVVYIDPIGGNDNNYGFTLNNPVQTFDAALIRVQNQSTLNPVKKILIKAAPAIGVENPSYSSGAAIKDTSVKSIENCDLLIESYDISKQNPRARIYFECTQISSEIGQIELLGNNKLYIRNVDLDTAIPYIYSINANQTIFGLLHSSAQVTFESDCSDYNINDCNIYLSDSFSLFQTNLPGGSSTVKGLIEVKFLNIKIINNNGALSPNQNGNQNLGVLCTKINSTKTGVGWQDAEIIMNNF